MVGLVGGMIWRGRVDTEMRMMVDGEETSTGWCLTFLLMMGIVGNEVQTGNLLGGDVQDLRDIPVIQNVTGEGRMGYLGLFGSARRCEVSQSAPFWAVSAQSQSCFELNHL